MKRVTQLIFLVAAVAVLAASCSKPVAKQAKYIPKDASAVMSFDIKNLREKSAGASINWDSLLMSANRENNDASAMNKWANLLNAGIDTAEELFMFTKSGGSIMAGQQTSVAFIAMLKDDTRFEEYLKKQMPEKQVQKENNYSYMALGNNYVAGWNEDVVIISMVKSGTYAQGTYNTGKGTPSQLLLTTLYTQKEAESIASVNEFKDLLAEKGDIRFWVNPSGSLSAVAAGITKLGDLVKDSYTAGTINFENGKATADFKSYVGKDLAAILNKYPGSSIDINMLERFPGDVAGFVSFSFNPQILTEFIRYLGAEAMVNQFLTDFEFTLDDVTKAFKGDFAVMFGDVQFTPGMKKPDAKILFNAKIGDKAAYNKIVSKLAQKGLMVQRGNQYVPANTGFMNLAWYVSDENLVVATDSALLQTYQSNTGKANISTEIKNQAKGKAAIFYVDMNRLFQSAPADTANMEIANMAKASFKDMIATADNFDGKVMKGHGEMRTMNDNENSLATLLKFFKAGVKFKDRRNADADSTESEKMLPPSTE